MSMVEGVEAAAAARRILRKIASLQNTYSGDPITLEALEEIEREATIIMVDGDNGIFNSS